ncbi:MAG: hypothetical protein V1663_00785 [archaeon]
MVWPFKRKDEIVFASSRVKPIRQPKDYSRFDIESDEEKYLKSIPDYKKIMQIIETTASILRNIRYDEYGNQYSDTKVIYNNFLKADPNQKYRTLSYVTIKKNVSEAQSLIRRLEISFFSYPKNVDIHHVRSLVQKEKLKIRELIKEYNNLLALIKTKKGHIGFDEILLSDF